MTRKSFRSLRPWFGASLTSARSASNEERGHRERHRGGTHRRGWSASIWLVLAAALAGQPPARAELLEPVTLQSKWNYPFQCVG